MELGVFSLGDMHMEKGDLAAQGFLHSGMGWSIQDGVLFKGSFHFDMPDSSSSTEEFVEELLTRAEAFSALTFVSLNCEVWLAMCYLTKIENL